MSVILIKLLLALGCSGLIGLVLARRRQAEAWLETRPAATVIGVTWFVLRLLPFVGIYLILGYQPVSDIQGYLIRWGSSALEGKLIYRDFECTYSPLYPYLIAVSLGMWYNMKAIALLMVVMELVALVLTFRFFRNIPHSRRLLLAVLYLMTPAGLIFTVIAGQEDIWLWLFAVGACLLYRQTGKTVVLALGIALGLLATKAVDVLYLLPFLFLVPKPFQLTAWLAGIGVVLLGALYGLVGLEFMQPIREAETLRAPSLLSVVNPWVMNSIGRGTGTWNWIGLAATVGGGSWIALRVRDLPFEQAFSRMWVGVYGLMMVVQQSAYSNYLFLFLPPLLFAIVNWDSTRDIVLFLLFNILCVVHPSFWWRMGNPEYLTPGDIFASGLRMLDYTLQLSIVVLTFYWVGRAGRKA